MRMRAKFTSVLTAAGAGILLTLGTVPSAHAAGSIVTLQYQNAKTGLCLDSDAKGKVYTKACVAGNPYQQWERAESGGVVALRNVATRRCLQIKDIFNPSALETNPACSHTWREIVAGGTFRYLGPFDSGTAALDSDAKGNAYAKNYGADNPYQQWYPTLAN
ncbi:hypothetical protein GCM10010371_09750 [Streptomyces subrutilus]|uniref:Ricin B lectin domain-containing protein n=1 Tax=Streptomyces subrutilus TaxID=36818 RepID=A0A918QIH9_9ACTN|nr:hypothetical protein GCM10010371_09750 [Streptomyces subrutilus]